MSDWSTIKKGFIEWMKKQDSDFKETDKDFAPIKYKEQFKLYIEKHDDDDNVNMDSFTKSAVENTNNKTLFDNMFDDYINNLETSDVVFKAIDGLADGKKDGKISAEEKNIFLTKVASAGFDGNIQNISFEDLIAAITKINNGDLSFLETKEENVTTYTASSASGSYGSSGSSSGSSGTSSTGTTNTGDLSGDEISNIQTLSTLTKTWAIPKVVHQASSSLLKTGQVSSDIYKQDTANIASLSELGEIDYEIESSQSDISNYTSQYQASKLRVSQANTYNSVNEAAYNEICGILAESNEQFKTTNDQITSLNTTITEAETALSVQCSAKDTLTISLSSVNCAIWDLNSQLANSEEGVNTSEIKNKLSSLKAERAEISKQLEQLSEEILANKTLLDTAYDNLDVALENLKTIDINNSKLSDNQKAQYQAIIENKQIIVQQNKLMTSAQAAITALDGYIQALYTRKEELLIEQKEEEAKNAKDNDEELSLKEKAQLANSVVAGEGGIKDQKSVTAKLLDGVNDGVGMMTPNISEDTSKTDEVSDEATKIYTIDGKKVKISYSKTDDDNYKCCIEVLDENNNSLYNTDNHKFIFTTDNLSYEYALTKAQGESTSYNLEVTNGYDDWNGSTLTIKDKDGTIISQREIKEIRDNENGASSYVSVVELDKDLNELSNSRIQTSLDEDNNVIITIQEGKIDENSNYVSSSAIRNTKDAQGFETKKELISYIEQETDGIVGIVEQIISTELFEYEDGKISSKKSYNGAVSDFINKSIEYNYSDGTEVSQISYDTQGAIQSKITTKYDENEKLSSITTTNLGVSIADNIEYNVETKHTINYDTDGKIVSQIVSTFGKDKDGNTIEEIKQYDSSGTLISDKYTQTANQISTIIEQTEEKTVISMEYDDVKIQLDYDGTTITGSNYSEILTNAKTAIDAGGNNIDEINITSPIELKFKLENGIWIVSN